MTRFVVSVIVVVVVVVVLVGACRTNENFCPGAPLDNCNLLDGGDGDGPTACASSAECAPPTAVCDVTGTGTCVECLPEEAGACTGTSPVCGADRACRACAAHVECGSNACLPDGGCGDDTTVAYVAPTGAGAACTQGAPCATIASALATGRPVVKLAGTLDEQVTLADRDVTLLADPGAQLTSTANGILIRIDGASAVQIFDLEIAGASGAGNPGISLQPGNTATVTLVRTIVSGNQGGGISASGGSLVVSRSTIAGNQGGGIAIGAGTTFAISNNFIFRNGDDSASAFGGLNLGIAVAGANLLAFNTIVDNEAAINSGGVVCNVPAFAGPNNIIARNSLAGSTTAAAANTSGACTYPTSAIQTEVGGLQFVDPEAPAPFDYAIRLGSAAIDQATTPVAIDIDHDGDRRPQGAQSDIGADELVP